jgi:tetratricopeptide (TPR) repeat protein
MGLGELLEVQGNLSEARPLYERALAIKEKVLGPDHPDTAYSAGRLAIVLQMQGNFVEARVLYERALAAYEKTLGSDDPQTNRIRCYFATLLLKSGLPAEALSLGHAALAAFGSKNSWTREAALITCRPRCSWSQ